MYANYFWGKENKKQIQYKGDCQMNMKVDRKLTQNEPIIHPRDSTVVDVYRKQKTKEE